MEEAQKGMLDNIMATELRELKGMPDAIQKQFDASEKRWEGERESRTTADDVTMEGTPSIQ